MPKLHTTPTHCLDLQAGDLASAQRVIAEATRVGMPPDVTAYRMLALACQEAGLDKPAQAFLQQAKVVEREQKAAEREQRERGRMGLGMGSPAPGAAGWAGGARGTNSSKLIKMAKQQILAGSG